MADRTEKVVLEFEVDESESVESINALTKANKELRAERNALNLQSEAGKKRAQEINALLDQNTNKIKTNVSAIEKQKINIGNYKSALDGVHPALGKLGQGLEAGTSGFMKMVQAAKAFILTPIGAILAALVTVFTLLKSALSTNNELLDKFENITTAIGSVVDVVVVRLGKLGEALVALFSGEFDKAAQLTGEAFTGLGDEISRAVAEGQKFLEMAREVEDAQRALTLQTARQENVIKQLVVASKNRNLTLDQQEDLLRKALALEEELVDKRTKLAEKDLETTAKTLAAKQGMYQREGESVEAFINRILKDTKSLDSLVDPVIEKVVALENARGSSLAFQEKLENSLAAIQEKRAEALRKQNDELAKQAELDRQARIARLEREGQEERGDPLEGAFDTQVKLETDLTSLMKEQLAQRQEDLDAYYKKKNDDAAKSAAIEVGLEQRKMNAVLGFTRNLQAAASEQSALFKASATAETLINTWAAAQAAYKSGSNINVFFGIASAAAAVAAGLANVARINNVQFSEGGYTGPGHRLKPAGIVHAGEVVWSQEDVARVGGPSRANAMRPTFPKAGRYTHTDGGIVVDSLTASTNQQLALSNIIKSIPPGEVSVVEIARVDRRVKVKEKISKR